MVNVFTKHGVCEISCPEFPKLFIKKKIPTKNSFLAAMSDMSEGPLMFSVPDCEGRKSCFRAPPDCWLEDPGCMFVSWQRDRETGQVYTFEGFRII